MTVTNNTPVSLNVPNFITRSSLLRDLTNKIAEASLNLLENNPWGMQAGSTNRPVVSTSQGETQRLPITLSVTPSWGVDLCEVEVQSKRPVNWEVELDPEEVSTPALTTTASAVAANGNAPHREFAQFLMTKVAIPAMIADTFANNILPPNALQSVVINEANKTFTLTLDHGAHKGEINDVPEAGIPLLNGSTVTMKQVIQGTFDPEKRSVDFESGAFIVKGGWKLGKQSASILGLQIVTEAGQDEIIIKTGVKNLPSASLSRFPNTFGHLSWS